MGRPMVAVELAAVPLAEFTAQLRAAYRLAAPKRLGNAVAEPPEAEE